ncbi:hypothetical protein BVH42_00075 [Campylobacter lari]|nr:hypothetical protein [Campylobacter lari]
MEKLYQKKYKNNYQEFITKNLKKAYKSQREFIDAYIDLQEECGKLYIIDERTRKQYVDKYKKIIQRGTPKNEIEKIYSFLLENEEIKKDKIYKPLIDDQFEREIFGDEYYKILIKHYSEE